MCIGASITSGPWGPLTIHGLKLAYRRLFDRAGVPGPKRGAHTIGHTFATVWLRYCGSLTKRKEIMPHKHM